MPLVHVTAACVARPTCNMRTEMAEFPPRRPRTSQAHAAEARAAAGISDGLTSDAEGPYEVVLPSSEGGCANGSCSMQQAPQLTYRPLHRALFSHVFKEEWLDARFAAAVADGSESALRAILHEEVAGKVFSFDMLKLDFCTKLLEELQHYEASGNPIQRPNSMNNYGIIVNQIGMRPLLDDLQRRFILPLSQLLFSREGGEFSSHHSFVVQYKQGQDLGLDMHHDDSDVTLNVCLGKEFTGATLSFCGGFGQREHRKHTHTYAHALGRAIIHLGSHRHGADDIASGERYNLIVWNTNAAWRASEEYKAINSRGNLHGADGVDEVPDQICLSYTHDPDYGEYRAYPPSKGPKPGARQMHVKRFTPGEAAARAALLKANGTVDFKKQVRATHSSACASGRQGLPTRAARNTLSAVRPTRCQAHTLSGTHAVRRARVRFPPWPRLCF